ncbi:transglycosylase SLT domain-containing protein [Enterobacter cloacae]|uniref:transglycosylase SLT domain-containing protein n=1 Tax=Enterobacter cloacae TaxID=550 RepID=UPI0034A53932
MKTSLLIVITVLISFSTHATCWIQAGQRYRIEPELLQAIAITESSLDSKALHQNNDGSYDIGLMQINSKHLKHLEKYNITKDKLLNSPCLSVMTGAWILSGFIQKYGYSWEAIGAYNAGGSENRAQLRKKYIRRVIPNYLKLKNSIN